MSTKFTPIQIVTGVGTNYRNCTERFSELSAIGFLRYVLSFCIFCLISLTLPAQVIGPTTAVVGTPTTWTSGLSGTTSYTWNISTPTSQPLPALLTAREIAIGAFECADYPSVWHDPSNGHYYIFFLSGGITAAQYPGQQNLWRIDLGTDPTTGTPPNNGSPTNLGNFNLGRGADCTHAMAYDSARGEWSCFLIRTGSNMGGSPPIIVRVDFGNTLANNPTTSTAINIPPAASGRFEFQAADAKIVRDRGQYVMFVGNRWAQPARLIFGADLQNVSPACDMLPTAPTHGVGAGSTGMIRSSAIELAYQGGNWYLYSSTTDAAGNLGSKMWRHDFGNSLTNTPTRLTGLGVPALGSHHWAMRIIPGLCGKEFIGYAQHSQGYIERFNFNGDLESTPVVTGNVGTRGANGWPAVGPQTPWDPSGFATFVYKDSLYAITSGHSWRKFFLTNLMYDFGSDPVQKYPPDNSFTHTFTAPGTYDITLTVNLQGFASAQFCHTVTVVGFPSPPVYTVAPADVCKVDTIVYQIDSVPGVLTWEWSYSGSGVLFSPTTNAARNELIFTAGATDGILSVRARNTYGVSAYTDTAIKVRQTPKVVVSPLGTHDICDGDSLRLFANADIPVNYEWFLNGSSIGAKNQQYYASKSGNYTVTVTTPDGFCPVSSDPVTINVHPQPIADLGNDTLLCASALPITLRNYGVAPSGTHYVWSNGLSTLEMDATRGGIHWLELSLGSCVHRDSIYINAVEDPLVFLGDDTVICEQFPLQIGLELPGAAYAWNTGATSAYIDVNKTGTYVLALNMSGCIVNDTIDIIAMPKPEIDLGGDRDICPEETIVLDGTYGVNSTYFWTTGENGSSISVTSPGVYGVHVITENQCVGGDTVTLTYYPKPTVALGPDTVVCEETPLVLIPRALNADSLIWSDGSVGEKLVVRYGGTYIVSAVNKCGSTEDTVVVMDVYCDLMLPNAFTPNNDGLNDIFRVRGNLNRIEFFEFSIFNRWGQKVFFTNDKFSGWDGVVNGEPAQLGTYMYLLHFGWECKQFTQSGSFHLMR